MLRRLKKTPLVMSRNTPLIFWWPDTPVNDVAEKIAKWDRPLQVRM